MGIIGQVLGAAAAGGIAGAGEGAAEEGKLSISAYNADNHERLRQQAIGERSERDIALKAEADRALERQKGHVVQPGATLYREGQPAFTSPDIKHPPELLDKLTAEAEAARAHARALDRGREPKEQTPQIEVKTDENGVRHYYDKRSGAFGYEIPGTDAKKPVSHWFTSDEPAVVATEPSIRWFAPNGQRLPNGPLDMRSRGGSQAAGTLTTTPTPVTDPLGLRASLPTDPSKRPPLTAFFGGGSPASQPAAPQAQLQPRAPTGFGSPPASTAERDTGKTLGEARDRLSAARDNLHSFGTVQRNRNRAGYEAAQQEFQDAKRDVDSALVAYQATIHPLVQGCPCAPDNGKGLHAWLTSIAHRPASGPPVALRSVGKLFGR
jgi:hypothetical protein